MIGNLLTNYSLTVQGIVYIYLYENSVYLSTSISLNSPELVRTMLSTLINNTATTDIIPGLELITISFYDTDYTAKAVASTTTTTSDVS
jgi:hypothetical protein